MKKITLLAACLFAFTLAGCTKTEYGAPMTETGEVYEASFTPQGHGSDVAIGFGGGKDGELTVTPIDMDIAARYAVVFVSAHGKFILQGEEDSQASELYKKLNRGNKVMISFREKFEVKGDHRKSVGFDFIDAQKIKEGI